MRISGPRAVLAGTVAVVVTIASVLAGLVLGHGAGRSARTTSAGPAAVLGPAAGRVDVARAVGALSVLRDWDLARARAWEQGDVAALRALYVDGSRAGERDVAMLREWVRRGLRVEGMATQVLGVELRWRTDRRIVLVVTDRLAGAMAVRAGRAGAGPDASTALPRDGPSTRRLVFVRSEDAGSRWLLASAQDARRRPVESTASTSGSAKR